AGVGVHGGQAHGAGHEPRVPRVGGVLAPFLDDGLGVGAGVLGPLPPFWVVNGLPEGGAVVVVLGHAVLAEGVDDLIEGEGAPVVGGGDDSYGVALVVEGAGDAQHAGEVEDGVDGGA